MRAFLFVGVLTLALSGISCNSENESSGISIDKSFRTLIWPQATVLAGAKIQELEKTDFYKRYAQRLDLPGLDEASQRLGFDPRKDVEALVVESDGERLLLLARGRLQTSEIRDKLGKLGAHATTYRSVPLIGDEKNSLAILGLSSAIGGSAPAVRSALDLRAEKAGAVAPELQARLATIPKSTQLWIVSSKGLPFADSPMRSDVKSALSNIVTFISGTTAGLTVGSGAKLDATITCISPIGAQRVHDALRGAIGLARLSTRDDQADLLKVYDAIDVKQNGNVVQVKADLNAPEIDKLMTYLPQMRSRAGQFLR